VPGTRAACLAHYLLSAHRRDRGFFTLYLAIISKDGLVVDDYYQKGKESTNHWRRSRRRAARPACQRASRRAKQQLLSAHHYQRRASAGQARHPLAARHARRLRPDTAASHSPDAVIAAPSELAPGHGMCRSRHRTGAASSLRVPARCVWSLLVARRRIAGKITPRARATGHGQATMTGDITLFSAFLVGLLAPPTASACVVAL